MRERSRQNQILGISFMLAIVLAGACARGPVQIPVKNSAGLYADTIQQISTEVYNLQTAVHTEVLAANTPAAIGIGLRVEQAAKAYSVNAAAVTLKVKQATTVVEQVKAAAPMIATAQAMLDALGGTAMSARVDPVAKRLLDLLASIK